MVSMEEIRLHPRMLNRETRLREYSKAEVVQPPTLTPLCAPDRRQWRVRLTPDRETESMHDPTPTHLQSSAHGTQGQHHLEVSRR